MAVGPGFNSPETQAAIAAQAAQAGNEPSGEPENTIDPDETGGGNEDDLNLDLPGTDPSTPDGSDPDVSGDEPTNTDNTPESKPTVEDDSADGLDAALVAAGFKPEEIAEKVKDNNGKFPEDVVTALKEKFDEAQVDSAVADAEKDYVAAQENAKATADKKAAATESMNTYIFETLAGGDAGKGKENFDKLSKWCKEKMSAAEIDTINTLLRSDNKAVVKQGLTMAVNHWKKGRESNMMSGDPEATNKIDVKPTLKPLTKQEFFKLMATEKYTTDPKYAKEVDARRRATMATEAWRPPGYYSDMLDT